MGKFHPWNTNSVVGTKQNKPPQRRHWANFPRSRPPMNLDRRYYSANQISLESKLIKSAAVVPTQLPRQTTKFLNAEHQQHQTPKTTADDCKPAVANQKKKTLNIQMFEHDWKTQGLWLASRGMISPGGKQCKSMLDKVTQCSRIFILIWVRSAVISRSRNCKTLFKGRRRVVDKV